MNYENDSNIKTMNIEQSLCAFSQTLALSLFEEIPLNELLTTHEKELLLTDILIYSISIILNIKVLTDYLFFMCNFGLNYRFCKLKF